MNKRYIRDIIIVALLLTPLLYGNYKLKTSLDKLNSNVQMLVKTSRSGYRTVLYWLVAHDLPVQDRIKEIISMLEGRSGKRLSNMSDEEIRSILDGLNDDEPIDTIEEKKSGANP